MFRGKAYASSFGRLVASRASSYDAPRNNNVTRHIPPFSTAISEGETIDREADHQQCFKVRRMHHHLDDWLPLELLPMMPQGTIILPGISPFSSCTRSKAYKLKVHI